MNRETDTVFLQTVGKFIAVQVQLATIPLVERIKEQAELIDGLKAQRIEDNNLIFERLVKTENSLDVIQTTPKPEIDRATVNLAISAIVESAVAALPQPLNGKDGAPGKDAEPGLPGKDGRDGKDAEPVNYEIINGTIGDMVAMAVESEIKKLSVKDGADGKNGKDGADVVAAFRDSDKHLILTLSNGVVKDVGQIYGDPGKDGAPGKDGKDGRDGFGFEDFGIEYDGEKTFTFYFVRGDEKKTFAFITPLIIYRGIWRQGKYLKGDAATYEGGMFVAKEDTETAPGTTGSDWQLATKRGREGKPGEKGKDGGDGKPGRDGRDLTQMAFDGTKY